MTTLTMKNEKRLDIIQRVYRSELTVGRAAQVMGLSERQCRRVKGRVKKSGADSLVLAPYHRSPSLDQAFCFPNS